MNATRPIFVPTSAPSSRGNQTSANCAMDRATSQFFFPPPAVPSESRELRGLELPTTPAPKSERKSAQTCANVARTAGLPPELRTSSSASAALGNKFAIPGDASVHDVPDCLAALAAATAADDHAFMDASIERAQPRGVASSGVGADANNASNAAPTTRGSIPETSAVAPETWLRSSTSRTALISSSVALAGGRSALGDRESNSESANARIGSGTSGGNAADRSDSMVLPNTECLYVPATVRKKSRPFSRCSTSIPSIGTPGSS